MGDALTLDMLYEDITDKARDRQPTTTNTDVAMYANNPKGNHDNCRKNKDENYNTQGNSNENRGDKEKFNSKCNHCSKVGHKEKDC